MALLFYWLFFGCKAGRTAQQDAAEQGRRFFVVVTCTFTAQGLISPLVITIFHY